MTSALTSKETNNSHISFPTVGRFPTHRTPCMGTSMNGVTYRVPTLTVPTTGGDAQAGDFTIGTPGWDCEAFLEALLSRTDAANEAANPKLERLFIEESHEWLELQGSVPNHASSSTHT